MKISELEPNSKVVNLTGEIGKLEESSETQNGLKFQEGILQDNSGQVKFTLWGDQVDLYKEGEKILINTGWCKSFEEELQVSTGKFGKITKIPKEKPGE